MLCDFSEASSDHTRLEESEALYIRSIVEGARRTERRGS
jgi:hypothetical protein